MHANFRLSSRIDSVDLTRFRPIFLGITLLLFITSLVLGIKSDRCLYCEDDEELVDPEEEIFLVLETEFLRTNFYDETIQF